MSIWNDLYHSAESESCETIASSSISTLEARVNYVLLLYQASRDERAMHPELQIGFRNNFRFYSPEDKAEILRYLKFKAQNFSIERKHVEEKRYLEAIDYFTREFL